MHWSCMVGEGVQTQRIDRFLWFARLTKTRSQAQTLCTQGHIRIDGRHIDRAHAAIHPGNVLSFALYGRVRVIRIEVLPARRGPPSEARACYTDLSPSSGTANDLQQHREY